MLADPDLTIELVASEPEVTSPVAIAWDEDGRLYVAEMNDYPAAPAVGAHPAAGRSRRRRTLRACDGLRGRAAVSQRRACRAFGGVLVTAAPEHLVLAR